MKNQIGLDQKHVDLLIENLNNLLSDYMLFYQNTRGLHWNVKGEKFFEMHLKFEELYTDLLIKVDEIAERILTLAGTPLHTFDDYLKSSTLKIAKNISQPKEGVASILESFEIIIKKQRDLLQLSSETNDEGTNAMMSDYIREQEKLVWMYSSYLNH